MLDLHGWTGQQIDRVELVARRASADLGTVLNQIDYQDDAVTADEQHIMDHRPPSVLLRCEADRKILAAHLYTTRVIKPSDGSASAGFGCETCHAWDSVPEGRGNCDTILALAEGYGWEEQADA